MISLDIIHSITGESTKKIKYLENGQNPTITFVGHSLVNSPLSFFNFSNISLSEGVMTHLRRDIVPLLQYQRSAIKAAEAKSTCLS